MLPPPQHQGPGLPQGARPPAAGKPAGPEGATRDVESKRRRCVQRLPPPAPPPPPGRALQLRGILALPLLPGGSQAAALDSQERERPPQPGKGSAARDSAG
nr:basic salivary proline-rich protein 2-like [Manis javanica]